MNPVSEVKGIFYKMDSFDCSLDDNLLNYSWPKMIMFLSITNRLLLFVSVNKVSYHILFSFDFKADANEGCFLGVKLFPCILSWRWVKKRSLWCWWRKLWYGRSSWLCYLWEDKEFCHGSKVWRHEEFVFNASSLANIVSPIRN